MVNKTDNQDNKQEIVKAGFPGSIYVNRVNYEVIGGKREEVSENSEEHQIEVADFSGQATGSVHVEFARTVNLGNFESCQVRVGVTLPCQASADGVDNAYNAASVLAGYYLTSSLQGMEQGANKK